MALGDVCYLHRCPCVLASYKGGLNMANEKRLKGVSLCGECGFYDWKKHKCTRGAKEETDPRAPFYDDCPPVDAVEVVHGRWTPLQKNGFAFGVTCSECNTTWDDKSNYCPNCGAKMDGGNEE